MFSFVMINTIHENKKKNKRHNSTKQGDITTILINIEFIIFFYDILNLK